MKLEAGPGRKADWTGSQKLPEAGSPAGPDQKPDWTRSKKPEAGSQNSVLYSILHFFGKSVLSLEKGWFL